MLDSIVMLLRRIWGLVRAGWDWVRQLVRTLVEDIASAFLPLVEATVPAGRSVPASPPFFLEKPPAQVTRPGQALSVAPASASAGPTPAPAESALAAPAAAAERLSATDKSDETALARMLASDDSPREVKFIRGWMVVQRQRARKVSMFEFLTRRLGYGPRNRKAQGQLNVYASTSEEPSEMDRAVARSLLSDSVMPSAAIRSHQPGQLIERGKTLSDEQILRRQVDLKEGIYGRIQGTSWLLLSPDAPVIASRKGQSAADAIDGVSSVPVMDAAAPAKQAAA